MIIGQEPFTRQKLEHWEHMTKDDAEYHAEKNANLRFMLAASIIKNMLLRHAERIGLKPQDIRVLDVGCGWGKVAIPLFDAGFQVTAIDISASMVDLLNKKKGNRDIQTGVCDITTTPVETLGTFDIIVMSQVIVHYKNSWEEFLTTVANFLAPGGCLVFEIRNFEFLQNIAGLLGQRPDILYRKVNRLLNPNSDGSHLHHGIHKKEMEIFAANNGFEITEATQIHPLMSQFATISLLEEKQQDYFNKFDEFCTSPHVIAFIQWLQKSFEHALPSAMSEETFYILKKQH